MPTVGTIYPKPLLINFIATPKIYDSTPNVNICYYISGILNNDNLNVSYIANFTDYNSGLNKSILITNVL